MANAPGTPSTYAFVAVNAMGSKKIGLRAAPTPAALADTLRRDHLLLLRSWRMPSWAGSVKEPETLPLRDEAALNEQLASLLNRGVPLIEALGVGATVVGAGTKARIERMREMVASGASFADACERVGGFDTVAIAVYRSAERSGDLGGAAARLAVAARRRMKIGGKAITLAIYPAVVLSISVVVATIMMLVVVPALSNMLREMNADLPWYSQAVFDFADFARANTLWMGTGVVGLLTVLVLARGVLLRIATGLLARLPVFRRLRLSIDSARFFSVMGAMSRSGVPVAEAMRVASKSISDPKLRSQFETLERRLVEGGVFRSLIEDVEALPVATRRLLVAAERAGDLDSAFDALSEDMSDQVDTLSDRLLALLEPALLVGMFAIIGALLIAIMLPMLTMFQSI
ncbi:MAG: hypothetical protein EA379_06290 [Phycisphaerales bacterium]|nr:MAG: hypothetical protein EA379_06290 [Phycisphaerales bacterium]